MSQFIRTAAAAGVICLLLAVPAANRQADRRPGHAHAGPDRRASGPACRRGPWTPSRSSRRSRQPVAADDGGGISPLAYILPSRRDRADGSGARSCTSRVRGGREPAPEPVLGSGPRGGNRAARVERAGRRTESAPGQESDPPLTPAASVGSDEADRRDGRPHTMHRPVVRRSEGASIARWTGVGALLVPVEVARRALLEPQPVVLGRLLEEVRRVLQHVLGGLLALLARVGERLLGRAPRRAPPRATDRSRAAAGGGSGAGRAARAPRRRTARARRRRRPASTGGFLGADGPARAESASAGSALGIRASGFRELRLLASRRAPRAPGARPRRGRRRGSA